METLLFIGCLIVGFYTGWHLHEAVTAHKANKLLSHINQQIEKQEEENIMKIKIEKHNDTLFVYDFHTDMFIVQAKDRPELEEKLEKLYPGKKFGATPANLKEIGFSS
jgi:hypothetical protein